MNIEKQQTEQQEPSGLHERSIRDGRNQKQMAVAAAEFAERWKDRGYERGESQPFWIDLLSNVFGIATPTDGFISFALISAGRSDLRLLSDDTFSVRGLHSIIGWETLVNLK